MRRAVVFLLSAVALLVGTYQAGYRLNLTSSMPRGVYQLVSGQPHIGDMVMYCPDPATAALALERGYLQAGSCPSGVQPLVKYLAATAGDTLRVAPHGILTQSATGDVFWPVTTRTCDSQHRPLSPRLTSGVIPANHALLLSFHEGSFDSRYFGTVPYTSLTKVEPYLTF